MSDGDDGDRRPKRRCARRATANETLYVGYVEDNETPEMIMKKFEALDKVRGRREGKGGTTARGVATRFSTDASSARAARGAAAHASAAVLPPP